METRKILDIDDVWAGRMFNITTDWPFGGLDYRVIYNTDTFRYHLLNDLGATFSDTDYSLFELVAFLNSKEATIIN